MTFGPTETIAAVAVAVSGVATWFGMRSAGAAQTSAEATVRQAIAAEETVKMLRDERDRAMPWLVRRVKDNPFGYVLRNQSGSDAHRIVLSGAFEELLPTEVFSLCDRDSVMLTITKHQDYPNALLAIEWADSEDAPKRRSVELEVRPD